MDEHLERDHQELDERAEDAIAQRSTVRHVAEPDLVAIPAFADDPLDQVFVVVETDHHEQHYDEQLATLLANSERRQRERRRLPFPRTHRISDEVLRRHYVRTHVRPSEDSAWHFRAWLPSTARAVRSATATVSTPASQTPGDPATTLTTLRLDSPKTSIDVLTLRLHERANLAEWLDEWLVQLGMTAASSRPRHTANGVMGDVLAIRQDDTDREESGSVEADPNEVDTNEVGTTVLRYTTVQTGTRVFVIVLRAPLMYYPMIARDYVLFATTFSPVEEHDASPRQAEA